MEPEQERGSKWDDFISLLARQDGLFDRNQLRFKHEITSAQHLYAVDGMQNVYFCWLDTLEQIDIINEQASNNYREAGNTILKSADNDPKDNAYLATRKYTNAIRTAPTNSLAMAQAHANRAASILKLKREDYLGAAYDDCIIARQLNYQYPLRLYWRQAQCAFEMNNFALLKVHVSELEEENIKGNIKSPIDISKLAEYKKKLESLEAQPETTVKPVEPPPARSKLIEKYTAKKGRHVVAREFIPINTEIIVDKAFAFVPVPHGNAQSDCHCCADTYIIPFLCTECRFVFYCSIKCRENHQAIHQYECKAYRIRLWEEIGISHLSTRCFLTGIRSAIDRIPARKSNPLSVWNQIVEGGDPSRDDYSRVLRLVTNYSKIKDDNCLMYALTAAMQTVYLKRFTQFFEHLPAKCSKIMAQENWELVVAALIMRHMGQLICNGHAITGMRPVGEFQAGIRIPAGELHTSIKYDRIFTALYPAISTLNHSCDPNIENKFEGTKLTLIATRDIKPSEEVLNCYGPHYKLTNEVERQVILRKQYCFSCDCNKCKKGNDQEHKKYHTYVCPNIKCKKLITITESERFWWRYHFSPFELKCTGCGAVLNFNWLLPLLQLTESVIQKPGILANLQYYEMVAIYEEICTQTTEQNLLRLSTAELILQNTIYPMSPDGNADFLKLAVDVYQGFVEYLGVHDEKAVYALLQMLDVLALASKDNVGTFQKPPQFVEFMNTLQYLTKRDRMIIDQYIEEHLGG